MTLVTVVGSTLGMDLSPEAIGFHVRPDAGRVFTLR
jgi:hypothetical protein